MKSLLVKSYAKINICLGIEGKRKDGYHDLDMVMLPLELHDSILINKLNAPDNFVTIDDFSNGLLNDDNVVSKAIESLSVKYKFNSKFRVNIHKVIPMEAGLAGGSSNAAFTLKGINDYLKLNASKEDLLEISRKLGADVPYFLDCVPARCQGIGEILTPITIKNDYWVLIVKPEDGCSTKEIYRLYDENPEKPISSKDVIDALAEGDDEKLAKSVFNVLEKPAISKVPEIQVIKDKMKALGLNIVLMSGSGSSVFALSVDKKLIKKAAHVFEKEYDKVIVTKIRK